MNKTEDPLRPGVSSTASIRVSVGCALTTNVLAVGADLKNTIALGRGSEIRITAVHGDLVDSSSYRRFHASMDAIHAGGEDDACVVAHDLHPTYLSATFARRLARQKVAIQHHHAHAVSCATDSGVPLPVVGIVCDGTGYGTDGAIWGGEVLLCHADSFRRVAHLDYFPLPGGDAAATWTWRPALGILRAALPDRWHSLEVGALAEVPSAERRIVERQLDAGLNTPNTSSLGRLFDAVACITGLCLQNDFEGKAAIALQTAAEPRWSREDVIAEAYPYEVLREADGPVRIDWRAMIRAIVADMYAKRDVNLIASRFHATVVAMLASAAKQAARESGVPRVALSGGCFHNMLLRTGLQDVLEAEGHTVALHERVSCGDAGLSLGQAVIAAAVTGQSQESNSGKED